MAFSGQVLDNPISGERFTFRRTAADTNGELLAFDLELTSEGHVPGAHVHPIQEERFEVVKGTMKFRRGLRIITARAGDTVIVPPGTVHRFKNAGDVSAHVVVEVRPALRMEELLETAVALSREGRTTAAGMPYPLDLALFMREFEAEVRAPLAPAPVARAFTAPLAWLARRRGLHSRYRPVRARLSRGVTRGGPRPTPQSRGVATTTHCPRSSFGGGTLREVAHRAPATGSTVRRSRLPRPGVIPAQRRWTNE